jgi:hypothetical protein
MNQNYKYSLEKGSKKFICPKCKLKRFVKYINQDNGDYLGDSIGRCDRETNCGYHFKPNQLINCETINIDATIKITSPSYHTDSELEILYNSNEENNFLLFLESLFDYNKIERIKKIFKISTSSFFHGSTVFWQIDEKNLIHAGKLIYYSKTTGRRYKTLENTSPVSWIHKINKIKVFNLNQCLFGLHQLQNINNQTQNIGIVESEKTAVILTIMYPDYYWMATGGKQNFKESMLKPIKDYQIVAYPDKGEYEVWFNKAKSLNQIGYKIEVNNWLETIDYDTGTDLADIIIEVKDR